MKASEYFQHARKLGAFPASECLALAREAELLDRAAECKRNPSPAIVARETLPDDSNALTLSFGIKVF